MPEEKHILSHTLDYDKITGNIFIGTNMCCQTHFDNELLEQGINADISLEEEHLDAPFGIDVFLWLPTKDHTAPTTHQFEVGITTLKKLEEQGIKTYVHCRLGHGRAPTFVAGYLIKEKEMTTEEAIQYIKQKRSVIHLEDIQIQTLKTLEKSD